MSKKRSDFFIRRLHSIIGLVPIGIFMVVHFLINSTSFGGVKMYEMTIGGMKGIPLIILAELIIIAIPILFHAIYGIYIVYVSKNNALRYTYLKNWFFYLQRITAIVTLIFVIFHVLTLRVFSHEPAEIITTLVTTLQNPLGFILYCIGVLSAVFHFSNGLFTLLITWGILQGPRVQKIFSWLMMLVFGAISIWAVALLVNIAGFGI